MAVALHAKRMHFDTMYLLPVSMHSDRFKKGTVGSPYAVSDPLRIADYLADPLLDLSAEELFGAFVRVLPPHRNESNLGFCSKNWCP